MINSKCLKSIHSFHSTFFDMLSTSPHIELTYLLYNIQCVNMVNTVPNSDRKFTNPYCETMAKCVYAHAWPHFSATTRGPFLSNWSKVFCILSPNYLFSQSPDFIHDLRDMVLNSPCNSFTSTMSSLCNFCPHNVICILNTIRCSFYQSAAVYNENSGP